MEVSNPEDSIPRCPEDTAPASSDAYIERIRMPRSVSLSQDTVHVPRMPSPDSPRVPLRRQLAFSDGFHARRSPPTDLTNRPDQY